MNNQVIPFNFENHQVRTLTIDNEPWFVGNDICAILDINDARQAISRLDEDERGMYIVPTPSGNQEMRCINESGLYSLILTSRKPEAKRFKKWVTSEVLPSIHKHGGYLTNEKIEEALLNPDTLINLATQLKTEKAEKAKLQKIIHANDHKVRLVDEVIECTGEMSLTEGLKSLGCHPKKSIDWLLLNDHLYRKKDKYKNILARQNHIDVGRFTVRPVTRGDKVFSQTRITAKGLVWLEDILPEYLKSTQRQAS